MSDLPSSETLSYRLARPADATALANMSRRLIEYDLPWWAWTPAKVTKAIKSPEVAGVVAQSGRATAGFGLMQFGTERAHLNLLAVEPLYRRRGIGRGMLGWLEDTCLVAGIRFVTLEVRAINTGARRFYQTLGFDETEHIPNYYCGAEAAVRLIRRVGVHSVNPEQ